MPRGHRQGSGITGAAIFEYEIERRFLWWTWTVYYTGKAVAEWSGEMYGEDADGNRGEWRTGIDDISWLEFYRNGKEIRQSELPEEVMKYFDTQAWNYDEWEGNNESD